MSELVSDKWASELMSKPVGELVSKLKAMSE